MGRYFIFHFPTMDVTNLFTTDVVNFLLLITAVVFSVLLCFVGYKMFGVMMLALICAATGYVGMQVAVRMTDNPVLEMFVTVMLMFLMVCLFYGGYIVVTKAFSIIPGSTKVAKNAHIFSAMAGGLALSLLCYGFVLRFLPVAVGIGAVCGLGGFLVQRVRRHTRTTFHTYNDLYKMM